MAKVENGAMTDSSGPTINPRLVNLNNQEQLTEEYLGINPKGQVPALTGTGLARPLTSSAEICDWLCEQYPKLLPEQHKETIQKVLGVMRSFHTTAVSWPKGSPPAPNAAENMLKREDLSPSHRKALEIKRDFHRDNFSKSMEPENVAYTEAKTMEFLDGARDVYNAHNKGAGRWLFGDAVGPTALDGFVGPFLARLLGSPERRDMVCTELGDYLKKIHDLPEWKSVMHDRPTKYEPSMGPVENIPL